MTTSTTVRLIGLPTDSNSSFRRRAAAAPARIRAQLYSERGNLATECGAEIGSDIHLDDAGDLPLTETADDDAMIEHAVTSALAQRCRPLLLGGDHSITHPVLRAMARHHGAIDILHIDAHPDLYHDYAGNPRSHASPFARIMEAGLARRLVQVGIRTLSRHQREQAERFGVEIVPMSGFALDAVPALAGPVYVSIDLDGIDPAHTPGVSHQEPGGLSVRQVLDLLQRIDAPVVGADVVEYNPACDVGEMTAIVAAKLVKELAALLSR